MTRTEKHLIKRSDKNFEHIDKVCFLSKELYNVANYIVRQEFINNGNWIRYNDLEQRLRVTEKSEHFTNLPNNSSQQLLMLLDRNWKSFFQAIKIWNKEKNKFLGRPNLPKYKKKDGRNLIVFTYNQVKLKDAYIHFPKKTGILPIKTKVEKLQQVRIVPIGENYKIEVIYEKEVKDNNLSKENYIAIDLGVNNLCAITSNKQNLNPVLIKGGIIKSINQFYNKNKALLQSKLKKDVYTSRAIQNLTLKRNCKVADFYHHVSDYIINHCKINNIGNIVIGYNSGWKQEVNIGNRNNQNFVQISHLRLIEMIQYKAEEIGISIKETKEHYTSKCSAFDLEEIKKHEKYMGRRPKRGLFKTSTKMKVNADVNGSLNILRKVIGNDFISLLDRGCVQQPLTIRNIYSNTHKINN